MPATVDRVAIPQEPRVTRATIILELDDGTQYTYQADKPDAAAVRLNRERDWRQPYLGDINFGPLPIEPEPFMITPPKPIQFTVTLGFSFGRQDPPLRMRLAPPALPVEVGDLTS